MLYEYDTVGRVSKVTPPQGANYRTQYTYNKNGSVLQVKVYDAGSAEDTDYTYNTTSGQLTQRNNPVVSSANVRTTYAYDAAGRLGSETVTREAGGTTNLYKTVYAYSWLTYGRQVIRTEQTYDRGWVDDNHVTYKWDSLSRQEFEQRDDWVPSAWVARYDVTQEYDKNGNRTRMHRNTVGGYESDYGNSEDLSYTYNVVNQLTAISDADDGDFSCTVTCDENNNITQIEEVQTLGLDSATLTTDFSYDWGNRLTQHQTSQYNNAQGDTWVTERNHTIDAIGRTAKSGYRAWWGDDIGPDFDTLEHVYDRARHIQNYDGTNYGEVWHWAGTASIHNSPLRSPNADTAGQHAYNIANDHTPQRRTFQNPTSEGDQRHLYGQGKPQAKNSSGSGSNWYLGEASESTGLAIVTVNSRTMFDGTVTATDMDRATDAREKGRIGIFGTGNAYAGSSGRVTSERIGRDLNPLGRGDGNAFVGGAMNYGRIAPTLPMSKSPSGWGNSVNNGCTDCGEGLTTLFSSNVGEGIKPSYWAKNPPWYWPPGRPWPPTPAPPPPPPAPPGVGMRMDEKYGCEIMYSEECPGVAKQFCEDPGPTPSRLVLNPCCGKGGYGPRGTVGCDGAPFIWPSELETMWCVYKCNGSPSSGGGTKKPPNCDCKGCVDACVPGDMSGDVLWSLLGKILFLGTCIAGCKTPLCINLCKTAADWLFDLIGAHGDVSVIVGYACCAYRCHKSLCDDCAEEVECMSLCYGSFGGGSGWSKLCDGGGISF